MTWYIINIFGQNLQQKLKFRIMDRFNQQLTIICRVKQWTWICQLAQVFDAIFDTFTNIHIINLGKQGRFVRLQSKLDRLTDFNLDILYFCLPSQWLYQRYTNHQRCMKFIFFGRVSHFKERISTATLIKLPKNVTLVLATYQNTKQSQTF